MQESSERWRKHFVHQMSGRENWSTNDGNGKKQTRDKERRPRRQNMSFNSKKKKRHVMLLQPTSRKHIPSTTPPHGVGGWKLEPQQRGVSRGSKGLWMDEAVVLKRWRVTPKQRSGGVIHLECVHNETLSHTFWCFYFLGIRGWTAACGTILCL